jgi:hypothetical protein
MLLNLLERSASATKSFAFYAGILYPGASTIKLDAGVIAFFASTITLILHKREPSLAETVLCAQRINPYA